MLYKAGATLLLAMVPSLVSAASSYREIFLTCDVIRQESNGRYRDLYHFRIIENKQKIYDWDDYSHRYRDVCVSDSDMTNQCKVSKYLIEKRSKNVDEYTDSDGVFHSTVLSWVDRIDRQTGQFTQWATTTFTDSPTRNSTSSGTCKVGRDQRLVPRKF